MHSLTLKIPPYSWFCWRTLGGNYLFWASRSGPFPWTPQLFSLFLVYAKHEIILSVERAAVVVVRNETFLYIYPKGWTLKTRSLRGWTRLCLRFKRFKRWSPDSDRCALTRPSSPAWNVSWHSKLVSTSQITARMFDTVYRLLPEITIFTKANLNFLCCIKLQSIWKDTR